MVKGSAMMHRHMVSAALVVRQAAEGARMEREGRACLGSVLLSIPWCLGKHRISNILNIQSHEFESSSAVVHRRIVTMVPYVIKPMRAVGGSKLKLTIKVSFNA